MKTSNVLSYMQLQYVLRGEPDYSTEQSLNDIDADFVNGSNQPTDEAYHAAASEYKNNILLDEYRQAIKQLLYNKAQEKDYDSEQSIASYATSTNEDWKSEAQQFVQWRDTVYEYSLGVLSDVQAELIEPPTMHDFLKDVPDFNWIK
jgi:hypothetical protein